jgi:hypothetical protein
VTRSDKYRACAVRRACPGFRITTSSIPNCSRGHVVANIEAFGCRTFPLNETSNRTYARNGQNFRTTLGNFQTWTSQRANRLLSLNETGRETTRRSHSTGQSLSTLFGQTFFKQGWFTGGRSSREGTNPCTSGPREALCFLRLSGRWSRRLTTVGFSGCPQAVDSHPLFGRTETYGLYAVVDWEVDWRLHALCRSTPPRPQ